MPAVLSSKAVVKVCFLDVHWCFSRYLGVSALRFLIVGGKSLLMKLESPYCTLSFDATIPSSWTEHFGLKTIRGGAISVLVATVLKIFTFNYCEDSVGAGCLANLNGVDVTTALTSCLDWFVNG